VRLLSSVSLGLLVIWLAGCATPYEPVPQGYTGSTANIADSAQPRSTSVSNVFAVVEIDGHPIANTFRASAGASQGKGFKLTTLTTERYVPAEVPLKLKLSASPMTGAPIQQMAMQLAGTFYSVEGVVDLKPRAGGKYVVRGELKKEGSTVWIEDVESGQPVTEKLTSKP